MAQTLCFPTTMLSSTIPSSPDPTHLRLLAFSVAEAALQSDPNSPSLSLDTSSDWVGTWSRVPEGPKPVKGTRRLWDVVERAKERRVRVNSSPSGLAQTLPPSPPISPAKYNFVLPANSPLAASIASAPQSSRTPPRLALSPRSTRAFPLYTRSAEPSPTNTTFSTLDQSRPPPEFVPRVSGAEFHNAKENVSPSQRLRSHVSNASAASPSRHTARLPSLAQIQAKMSKAGHRRNASAGSIPIDQLPRIKPVQRSTSTESVEILQTPTDENPPSAQPHIVTAGGLDRRPPTPPSPVKEPRLAPFLRQRTSGRIAGANTKARPLSMPPLQSAINVLNIPGLSGDAGPVLTITPPSLVSRKATVPPPSPSRVSLLSTPPNCSTRYETASPTPSSPTGSIRSFSTASPTLSVPMITCTPAPSRLVRNGVEEDSDEEEGDVVLFEGELEDDERVEREKRGKEMLEKLMLRRRSD